MLALTILTERIPSGVSVDVWVDTGFTGDLVIPLQLIQQLELTQSGCLDAVLADGSPTELDTYSCKILWFEKERSIEAIANDGETPLLGVGLLLGKELRVDYTNLKVSLEPAQKALA